MRHKAMWGVLACIVTGCGTEAETPAETTTDTASPGGCGTVCEGMTRIEPGTFIMGAPDGEGRERERPAHPVTIEEAFYIDTHEVTNAQFAEFLKAHGNSCPHDGAEYSCYDCNENGELDQDRKINCGTWDVKSECQRAPGGPSNGDCSDHPVTLVFWPGARAYCEWAGKRLPSEAEWKRAANGPGGADGKTWRRFPWGNDCPRDFNDGGVLTACLGDAWTATGALANCEESGAGACLDGWTFMAPVGSFPGGKSVDGVFDLSGNAMEWVEDCFHEGFAPPDGAIAPTDGSAWVTQCDLGRRVATGGSAVDNGSNLRAAFRGGDLINEPEADFDVGFRCAYAP